MANKRAIVLKMIAKELNLFRSTIEDRIKLQKTIYLLQSCGFNLGYGFSWYKYGPYSQELADESYAALSAQKVFYEDKAKDLDFSQNTKNKLDEFKNKINGLEAKDLELIGSVAYLKKNMNLKNKNEIIEALEKKKKYLFDDSKTQANQINKSIEKYDELFKTVNT